MPEITEKTKKRVLDHLNLARQTASAAGAVIAVPASIAGVDLDAVYAVRHALSVARLAQPKGSTKRQILRAATVIALCADKVLRGSVPLSPDSHRSAAPPSPARPSTFDEAIGDAFEIDAD